MWNNYTVKANAFKERLPHWSRYDVTTQFWIQANLRYTVWSDTLVRNDSFKPEDLLASAKTSFRCNYFSMYLYMESLPRYVAVLQSISGWKQMLKTYDLHFNMILFAQCITFRRGCKHILFQCFNACLKNLPQFKHHKEIIWWRLQSNVHVNILFQSSIKTSEHIVKLQEHSSIILNFRSKYF